MAGEQEDEVRGIPRLLRAINHAMEASEQHAVKYGTSYVEDEQRTIQNVRNCANLMGGDVTDPQFYAGMMTMVSFIISAEESHPLSQLLGARMPIDSNEVLQVSRGLARMYDEVVKSGVEVIPTDGK